MTDTRKTCPECGSSMYANGKCDDCGYTAKAESKNKGKSENKKA